MLCAFAVDEAVAAVIEALMAFGCFLGEPPSVTVGPTDCERPTVKIVNSVKMLNNFPFQIINYDCAIFIVNIFFLGNPQILPTALSPPTR